MSPTVYRQESKEFQMKVVWPPAGQTADLQPGDTDQQIFQHVTNTLSAVVTRLAGPKQPELVFNNNLWRREGIRYDTAGRDLKRHNLTLAIEATDQKTKLKCKQHQFIPELLFDKPKHSPCLPDEKTASRYQQHAAKFKLEEDLHFSNIKYCASGSLFVKGRANHVTSLDDFSRYFPGLATLLTPATPLIQLSHWDEAIFDSMVTGWGKCRFADWMLVNRWDWETNTLLESELSFKVGKALADDWDYRILHQAATLYLELQHSGIFMAAPPIFFYDNPVSSTDITVAGT
ncbi:hypothetical protein [uncultured Thiodictyon sp.]|uniref:hypothetical protein n=1 Tax=uncultured Thiodictyon sp. TaxID=1846217 RepID=UPI0025D0C1AB|nr:hypothetical protein [uncultured Thiodictyon sp.]